MTGRASEWLCLLAVAACTPTVDVEGHQLDVARSCLQGEQVIGRAKSYDSMEGGTRHCVVRKRDGAAFTWSGPAYQLLPENEWTGCSAAQLAAVQRAKLGSWLSPRPRFTKALGNRYPRGQASPAFGHDMVDVSDTHRSAQNQEAPCAYYSSAPITRITSRYAIYRLRCSRRGTRHKS